LRAPSPEIRSPSVLSNRAHAARAKSEPVTSLGPAVTALGIGGAGSHLVELASRDHSCSVTRSIVIDSDEQALERSHADMRICLDKRQWNTAFETELSERELTSIEDALAGAGPLCILAGLGGRTASCVASQIVTLARQAVEHSVAIVTTPPAFEGGRRRGRALIALFLMLYGATQCGAEEGVQYVSNEDVLATLPKPVSIWDAYSATDRLVIERVRRHRPGAGRPPDRASSLRAMPLESSSPKGGHLA
jgi:cell division GTPase FtsZ